ncbi:MAG: hypothetical protein ACK4NR_01375 [Micavibrio sp.]
MWKFKGTRNSLVLRCGAPERTIEMLGSRCEGNEQPFVNLFL